MNVKRKIIQIDEERCNGCGQCVPSCAEGAIQIVNGKARLISDQYCDGLGACLGECPQDALKIVEREAPEFDEEAVEQHLHTAARQNEKPSAPVHAGCPSAAMRSFDHAGRGRDSAQPAEGAGPAASELTNWPVQIRLVPPTAQFLKNADLLVAADCVPVAYPAFHKDFLQGRVVLLGCPKFDDAEAYIHKFAQIFKTANVKSVMVVVMEVPCCQGLPAMVKEGMDVAGKHIPIEKVVVSAEGEILKRVPLAA
ncbi:MAG: 4Fe-4S binding protein [Proteobacteria bacterium]|nr:4Fe-4S binding protein [Pseudomonadota bacterium]